MADEGAKSSNKACETEEKTDVRQPSSKSFPFASSFYYSSEHSSAANSSSLMGCSSQGSAAKARLSSNPFAIKIPAPARSVTDKDENKETRPLVAPPTLKLIGSASSLPAAKLVLKPSTLAVHTEKLKDKYEEQSEYEKGSKEESKENSSDEGNVAKRTRLEIPDHNGKESSTELLASDIPSTFSTSTSQSEFTFSLGKPSGDKSPNGTFVFGQNLHERALNYDGTKEKPSSPEDSHNLTFEEAALKKEELEKMEQQNQEVSEKLKKSLSESAREYESRQVKRKFDEVTVVTGEEEESNVLQMNCKLFAYDKVTMNWQERGRGILRLNDRESEGTVCSRVVMRIHGSLRVVLNTKIWSGMTVELPSKKSVRLTAQDPQGVKVFLVMAQPKDAEQLFNALDWRVATLKKNESASHEGCPNSSNAACTNQDSNSDIQSSNENSSSNTESLETKS